jgi:hypothetical protein
MKGGREAAFFLVRRSEASALVDSPKVSSAGR